MSVEQKLSRQEIIRGESGKQKISDLGVFFEYLGQNMCECYRKLTVARLPTLIEVVFIYNGITE